MPGFGAFGNAAGIDAVGAALQRLLAERILRQREDEARQQQAIENQQKDRAFGLQERGFESLDAQRKATEEQTKLTREAMERDRALQEHNRVRDDAARSMSEIPPDSELDPSAFAKLRAFAAPGTFQDEGSYQPEGPAQGGGIVPPVPERVRWIGTAAQLEKRKADERAEKAAAEAAKRGDEAERHNRAMENKPTGVGTVTIQTVDDQGNPVTRIVPKVAGSEFKKPPSATSQSRLDSAQAVKQTGEDMIAQLSDPKFKAVVGPAMGRYSTLREFVGNPPPEFAQLAGQIESYALANMGVHGMRSSQGAQQIVKLLDQHHTPESLIAAIRGLNAFSDHFLTNAGKGGAPAQTPDANDAYAQYLARTKKP